MNRIPIHHIPEDVPQAFLPFLDRAQIYDSSCSPDARVYYINKDNGLYLKSAPSGSLHREAQMTRYFHGKGVSARVLAYESGGRDWLLTQAIPGEDCTHPMYLAEPKQLCDTTAELLRMLHSRDGSDCPVVRTPAFLSAAQSSYRAGRFDSTLFAGLWEFSGPEEAWKAVQDAAPCLKSDILTHGDYCLPNIMLSNWKFSGFIDVGSGGQGDRHMDLLWGMWSLRFNLKTTRFCERFLDAYGREDIEPELLRAIAAIESFF